MKYIAIMGFGTIGSGVYDVFTENAGLIKKRMGEDVAVRRILDLREFPDSPAAPLVTHRFEDILEDPEISLVVETMGGVHPALDFELRLLAAGKSVVTSNKELVEKCGPELFEAAKASGAAFLFEGSVGGGIPIIRGLTDSVIADRIDSVFGILNGTTNYILTQMAQKGVSYDEALREAQRLGYAEKDPTADVEGHDAARKIAILASLILGRRVCFEDVVTEGITGLSSTDFAYARELNMCIRLVASADLSPEGARLLVSPRLVPPGSALYGVSDVFNAVAVHGNMADTLMFYGRGAGSHATASAVSADVLTALSGRALRCGWSGEKAETAEPSSACFSYFVRISGDIDTAHEVIRIFGGGSPVSAKKKGEFGFVTPVMSEAEFSERSASLDGFIKRIRLL